MLILKEPFQTLWKNKDAFTEVEAIQGKIARAKETRKTLRFEVNEQGFYLKLHHGTSLRIAINNLLRLRLPVLGADCEWNAIHRLSDNGINTMQGVAFGQRGNNPLTCTSFIITKDLAPVIDLHEYSKNWRTTPPSFNVKQMIIRRLATMVRKMHQCGINHRDCYLGHFMLHLPFDSTEESLKISVIDLHRAQIRKTVPKRWRDKDLIGLYFSSMDIGLTKRDILRFMKIYFDKPLRSILEDEKALIKSSRKEAERIQKRMIRKAARFK